ncbi:MAG: hypothetical protein JXR91_05890 [Deltaproteobacteria bacterium]|nr:hypothetical protein [Deltaproteobacteria bacterium]
MGFEKIALVGVLAVVFIVVLQGFRVASEVKKMGRHPAKKRRRRKISTEPAATEIASTLIMDIVKKYPGLCNEAKETKVIPKKLQKEIDLAFSHYLDRVNYKFKALFNLKISEIIFQLKK